MRDSFSDTEGNDSDSDGLSATPTWHLIPSLASAASSASGILQADHVDFLSTIDLTSPTVTSTILNALFRPAAGGGFSPYTVAEALRGYVEAAWVPVHDEEREGKGHVSALKDPNAALRAALSKQYPTLRARVGAVVGARLKDPDLRPSKTGAEQNPNASVNVFGATLLDLEDGFAGGDQQREYYATLRRDWEGFLARCREIEKAGRWPVALGVVGNKTQVQNGNVATSNGNPDRSGRARGECVVVERERMGMLVGEDEPLAVHRRVIAEIELENEDSEGLQLEETRFTGISRRRSRHNAPRQLIRLALSLKSFFAPSGWAEVRHELYTTVRNSVEMLYQDLLLDLARRVGLEDMDRETATWVFEQIDAAFEDDETQFQEAIDAVSRIIRSTGDAEQIEEVKVEDDEDEVGRMLLHSTVSASNIIQAMNGLDTTSDNHNQWTKSLTASYLSATLEARYEIASSIIFLLTLLKSKGHDWVEQTSAQHLDELFAGLRSNSILRQIASRVMEGEREGPSAYQDPDASGFMDIDGMTRANPNRPRAGTVDSVMGRMAGMRVGAGEQRHHVHFAPSLGPGPPPLPPTTRGLGSFPLLQSLLPPLKRNFKLPYASDAFLFSNGIIESDTLSVASVAEVQFAEELRRRGNYNAAADVIDWLPKGNACCYVAARLRIQRRDYDEAADLFERSARSFGELPNSPTSDATSV
jgi:nuclear pore complex protein Nup160